MLTTTEESAPEDVSTSGRAAQRPRLRAAVSCGPRELSPSARAAIRDLGGARPSRFLAELALAWLVVIGVVWTALRIDHWAFTMLAIVVVATRQMVMALLLHEQVHRLGLRARWGDAIVNLVAVYPLLATTVEDYAEVHLRHHRLFMQNDDPDFVRKSGAEWRFPMSAWSMFKLAARDVFGLNTLRLIRGKTAPAVKLFKRPQPTPRWVRPVYYLAAALVISLAQGWGVVLLYWVLPILTVTQLLLRWIAVLEHEYEHHASAIEAVTPLVRMRWWQRVAFPDLNFALHVYHHHHPGVSWSKLPAIHRIYQSEGKVDQGAVFEGAGAYLRWLLGGPQGQSAQSRGQGS